MTRVRRLQTSRSIRASTRDLHRKNLSCLAGIEFWQGTGIKIARVARRFHRLLSGRLVPPLPHGLHRRLSQQRVSTRRRRFFNGPVLCDGHMHGAKGRETTTHAERHSQRPAIHNAAQPTKHMAREIRTDPAQASGLRAKKKCRRWSRHRCSIKLLTGRPLQGFEF